MSEDQRDDTRAAHKPPWCSALSPALFSSLSFPPLHDSSISNDTLVPAGQSGLALLSQNERWTFSLLPHSQRTEKWQVEGLTQTRGVKLFRKCQCIWWTHSAEQSLSLFPLDKWEAKYPKCPRPQIICMATWKGIHLQSIHSVKAQEGVFPLVYLCLFPLIAFKCSLKEIYCTLEDRRGWNVCVFSLCFFMGLWLKKSKNTKWIIVTLDSFYWHNVRQVNWQLVNASCQKALHGSVFFEDMHW